MLRWYSLAAGIATRTLHRAKDALGVRPARSGAMLHTGNRHGIQPKRLGGQPRSQAPAGCRRQGAAKISPGNEGRFFSVDGRSFSLPKQGMPPALEGVGAIPLVPLGLSQPVLGLVLRWIQAREEHAPG